jgi:imidazolonepropionase-like amidohydrolase
MNGEEAARHNRPPARWARVFPAPLALALAATALAQPTAGKRPHVYAITGARVMVRPDQVLESATIVLRDGLIEAVGAEVAAPPDAVVIDGQGLTAYAGLIDASSHLGLPQDEPAAAAAPTAAEAPWQRRPRSQPEPPRGLGDPNPMVHPEQRAADRFQPDLDELEKRRKLGFTTVLVSPSKGVLRGSSALIQLLGDDPTAMMLRAEALAHVGFDRSEGFGDSYPNSLMGAIALLRQSFYDARRLAEWQELYHEDPRGLERPPQSASLEALRAVVEKRQAVVFHLSAVEDFERAVQIARELELDAIIQGTGLEYEIVAQARAAGLPLIVPLALPEQPKVDDESEALDVTLEQLRRWDAAPATAARLHQAGVRFALTTEGLAAVSELPANLRRALERGLPFAAALAALTTEPARMLGVGDQLGTLEPGKIANLILADGELFAETTKIQKLFIDGRAVDLEEKLPGFDPAAQVDPTGTWEITFEIGGAPQTRAWVIGGSAGDYSGSAETQSGTVEFDSITLTGNKLEAVYKTQRGSVQITAILQGDRISGSAEAGPVRFSFSGRRQAAPGGGGP